ncbi:hypothetical protein M4D79_28300 [Mycolicibacterium novocastrense]|nr:hypothetical protein M4D79_28300 [Mycolicibacterium novocastrense]
MIAAVAGPDTTPSTVAETDHAVDHGAREGEHTGHQHEHGGIFGERTELIFAGLAGTLLLVGWLLATFADTPRSAELVVYSLAFFFGAFFTVQEAFASVRQGRFEIDFLMLVSAAGAAALGEVAEGCFCCSCSVSATRWRAMRWGEPAERSKRSPRSLRRRH